MNVTRRLMQLAVVLGSLAAALPVVAQEYPSRPIKIVVASVPGSAPDVLARVLGEKLGPALKQPVVVENKPGAGGVIGVDSVAKAAPDGYTLVIGHDGTMALSTVIHKNLPYDPVRDFVPVTPLGFNEFVLVANAGAPPKTFPQFLDYAKAQQGKITYGSAGVGTPNQIIMEQLAKDAGFTAVHVPYKGGAAAIQDLVGGQIQFMVSGIAPALPHIRSGKLVALAVPQAVRSPVLPEVPTIGETVKGFSSKSWFGLFAPARTPPEVVARLNREVRAVLELPEVREKLAQQGLVTEGGTGDALATQVNADIARYRILSTQINLDPQN